MGQHKTARRLKQGDRVRLSARSLRALGDHSGECETMTGVVLDNRGLVSPTVGSPVSCHAEFIKVCWDGDDRVLGFLSCNLERVK